jgi:hypothetical protein
MAWSTLAAVGRERLAAPWTACGRLCVRAKNTQQPAPTTPPADGTDTDLGRRADPAEPDDGLVAETIVSFGNFRMMEAVVSGRATAWVHDA